MNKQTLTKIIIFTIGFFLFFVTVSFAINVYTYNTQYDQYFNKYSKRFFGVSYNWLWFKAQGMAESNLNPNAESWVGAKGIMQLMPDTYEEIRKELNIPDAIYSPEWNIAGGIYYDRKMYNQWTAPRPEHDRRNFMFASYNAGLGNILKAQKACQQSASVCMNCHRSEVVKNCNLWDEVKQYGVLVKTWRHEETINYIERINRFMQK